MRNRGSPKPAVALAQPPEDPFTWPGIFAARDARAAGAKALSLGVQWGGADLSIDTEVAAGVQSEQRGTTVQQRELTAMDRKILTALRSLGGFASAKEILARVSGASLFVIRSRLDRLAGESRVRSVPGQGYLLEESP